MGDGYVPAADRLKKQKQRDSGFDKTSHFDAVSSGRQEKTESASASTQDKSNNPQIHEFVTDENITWSKSVMDYLSKYVLKEPATPFSTIISPAQRAKIMAIMKKLNLDYRSILLPELILFKEKCNAAFKCVSSKPYLREDHEDMIRVVEKIDQAVGAFVPEALWLKCRFRLQVQSGKKLMAFLDLVEKRRGRLKNKNRQEAGKRQFMPWHAAVRKAAAILKDKGYKGYLVMKKGSPLYEQALKLLRDQPVEVHETLKEKRRKKKSIECQEGRKKNYASNSLVQ